ncbi:thioesterase family protein [Gimesia fumaroli]|uniref:Fluoroacetyl-CoA thioesterase n=1 Tax=Gimesia fumaroli TaxID=2527976 RepID=A0A518II53_9PLAN|nr:thioesterase family protein [Gimesia fumaroli]QDV52768.1 Fluoroacetyl-CoA thioesterase [Gimesia fumaroli]
MDQAPRIGSSNTISFEVEQSHSITFSQEADISVLSTPSLIWFLEQAALQFLQAWLEDKSLSVGTHVDVEHLAPTPVGATVNCTARLIYQDGPVYRFSVEAYAGDEKIAKGLHSRRIIQARQLIKRLQTGSHSKKS